jgi:hypothetical protein
MMSVQLQARVDPLLHAVVSERLNKSPETTLTRLIRCAVRETLDRDGKVDLSLRDGVLWLFTLPRDWVSEIDASVEVAKDGRRSLSRNTWILAALEEYIRSHPVGVTGASVSIKNDISNNSASNIEVNNIASLGVQDSLNRCLEENERLRAQVERLLEAQAENVKLKAQVEVLLEAVRRPVLEVSLGGSQAEIHAPHITPNSPLSALLAQFHLSSPSTT